MPDSHGAPRAVLFDLGNTLARYCTREEFPDVLRAAAQAAAEHARAELGLVLSPQELSARVALEDHEDPERRVRPLEGRLARIFGLSVAAEAMRTLCRAFTEPMFRLERRYEDAVPALVELRRRGFLLGLVSNTPWGSPGDLWRERLGPLGFAEHLDVAVFCTDVGWRKPNAAIFLHALDALRVEARDAVFVGDDPRWDVAGPERVGMPWVLLDRDGLHPEVRPRVATLTELLESPYTRAGE